MYFSPLSQTSLIRRTLLRFWSLLGYFFSSISSSHHSLREASSRWSIHTEKLMGKTPIERFKDSSMDFDTFCHSSKHTMLSRFFVLFRSSRSISSSYVSLVSHTSRRLLGWCSVTWFSHFFSICVSLIRNFLSYSKISESSQHSHHRQGWRYAISVSRCTSTIRWSSSICVRLSWHYFSSFCHFSSLPLSHFSRS